MLAAFRCEFTEKFRLCLAVHSKVGAVSQLTLHRLARFDRSIMCIPRGHRRKHQGDIVLGHLIDDVQRHVREPGGLVNRIDLSIDQARIGTSLYFQTLEFPDGDCAVVEGCVNGSGPRDLMRFDVAIRNMGKADLLLGTPLYGPTASPSRDIPTRKGR